MTNKEAIRIVEAAVARVSEHFDAVQIVASWQRDGGTACCKRGAGNYYARRAMCQEFVEEDQANTLAKEIEGNRPPDDGDEWKNAGNPS